MIVRQYFIILSSILACGFSCANSTESGYFWYDYLPSFGRINWWDCCWGKNEYVQEFVVNHILDEIKPVRVDFATFGGIDYKNSLIIDEAFSSKDAYDKVTKHAFKKFQKPSHTMEIFVGTERLRSSNIARLFHTNQKQGTINVSIVRSKINEELLAEKLTGLQITYEPQTIPDLAGQFTFTSLMPTELMGNAVNGENIEKMLKRGVFGFKFESDRYKFETEGSPKIRQALRAINIVELLDKYNVENSEPELTKSQLTRWCKQNPLFKISILPQHVYIKKTDPSLKEQILDSEWTLRLWDKKLLTPLITKVLPQVYPNEVKSSTIRSR